VLLYLAYSQAETCELGHIGRLDPTSKVNDTMVERCGSACVVVSRRQAALTTRHTVSLDIAQPGQRSVKDIGDLTA